MAKENKNANAAARITAKEKELDLYLRGAANLYGHLPPIQFIIVYNRYHKEQKLIKDDLMNMAAKLERLGGNYHIYENAIINTRPKQSIIDGVIAAQAGKQFYIPLQEEIISYADDDYFPISAQLLKLQGFITERYKSIKDDRLEYVLRDTEWVIRTEGSVEKLFKLYEKIGIRCKKLSDANLLSDIFMELSRSTRKWACCGYTLAETEKL